MGTGGSFKSISLEDIEIRSSTLNQLVDVIQEDVHGSATRRKYQVFVTGGVGTGVTSSLFQTVYDQDFSLQTANPIFDMTVGLFNESELVNGPSLVGVSASTGKKLFSSQSLMMREKIDVYRQYAANLLGDANASFYAPYGSLESSNRIDEALFVSFKRLFSRDKIKRETFAMRLFRSGVLRGTPQDNGFEANTQWSATDITFIGTAPTGATKITGINTSVLSTSGSAIFTDLGAASRILNSMGGEVGNIVNANNTDEVVGLMFYEHGTAVFDMKKIFWMDQYTYGPIDAMANRTANATADGPGDAVTIGKELVKSSFKNFLVSGSIDQIVDHVASCRFGNQSQTSFTFQNVTNINSSLIFCRASADEFNYSTNPTFKDSSGRIRVIDPGQEDYQRSFTFITTVGLHDEAGNLLAVAKLSRPIEKNDEKDLTIRVRLDF